MARASRQVRNPGRVGNYSRPQPIRRSRRAPELRINLRVVVALALLVGAIFFWWRSFVVSSVKVTGSQNYASSLVVGGTQAALKQHWWWRNLVLINTAGLQKSLLASQPQLASASISRHWPHQIAIKVTERKPNLIWRTGGKDYLLSQDGIIVGEASQIRRKLPVVEDTTNLPVKLGAQVVPGSFVNFCLDLISVLPKQGLQVKAMQIPATIGEVDVVTNQNYLIKFDTTRTVGDEVGDLVKVLNLLKSQNKQPSQYIDLRINGSAYYK